ncbi:DUF202 domain-containing protein [Luethyella okanaganae]|uniref:DUF202 domain-containing protein n=1 Tax=Luethyella okanaganae TaxID=69372 RepID=A0ABW1VD40_9MICO
MTSATASPARDPGLQPERTALAWSRTALAISVNALLSVRAGLVGGATAFIVVGVLLLAAAAASVVYGNVRRHQLLRTDVPVRPHAGAMLAAAIVTTFACAAGVASVLYEH